MTNAAEYSHSIRPRNPLHQQSSVFSVSTQQQNLSLSKNYYYYSIDIEKEKKQLKNELKCAKCRTVWTKKKGYLNLCCLLPQSGTNGGTDGVCCFLFHFIQSKSDAIIRELSWTELIRRLTCDATDDVSQSVSWRTGRDRDWTGRDETTRSSWLWRLLVAPLP